MHSPQFLHADSANVDGAGAAAIFKETIKKMNEGSRMDDLKRQRAKRQRNAAVEALLNIPGSAVFGPYLVLYNEEDGIQLLQLKDDEGIVKLFSHKG